MFSVPEHPNNLFHW